MCSIRAALKKCPFSGKKFQFCVSSIYLSCNVGKQIRFRDRVEKKMYFSILSKNLKFALIPHFEKKERVR
jgi:hypothetical protein